MHLGFKDKSKYTQAFDGNYNFQSFNRFCRYSNRCLFLNRIYSFKSSSGTIFTDRMVLLNIKTLDFIHKSRKVSWKSLIVSLLQQSLRYDDSDVFDANISPRLSLGYSLGIKKTIIKIVISKQDLAPFHLFYLYHKTQDLYIGLDVGKNLLVGGAPDNFKIK